MPSLRRPDWWQRPRSPVWTRPARPASISPPGTGCGCRAARRRRSFTSSRLPPWMRSLTRRCASASPILARRSRRASSRRPRRSALFRRPRLKNGGRSSRAPASRHSRMDLVIRNVCVCDRVSDGPLDIGIERGRIVAIEPGLNVEAKSYDAQGRLACAGLIESHIHLDKSRIIDRCAPQQRTKLSPVKGVSPLKKDMSLEDVRRRAAQTLEQCIVHGATRMRTQVEVDPGIGMRGFEAVQSLIADYKWAIDIELCVFPQEGLISYPGTDELLVEALKRGAKVIGGAPRYDSDQAGQIRRIFALASEFDVDIDMHLDVGHTPEAMNIHLVRELTDQYKRGGRVVVGHMAKLSLIPPGEVATLGRSLADSGIAVTVLPATDLFLMGRDQDHNVRRGVADANLLIANGVNCSLSSNNILNPATP